MRMIGRYCLTLMMAVALVASGMPFAHAMQAPVGVLAPAHDMHDHHAAASDHAMHGDMVHMAHATAQDHDDGCSPAAGGISGKTCCSMCATAYVAPSLGQTGVTRLGYAVHYWVLTAFRPDTLVFIDPGIPIV